MEMVSSLQPKINVLAGSSAHATARASPSVGEYLVSASFVNRDPANTSFQPSLQHMGALSIGQEQCF